MLDIIALQQALIVLEHGSFRKAAQVVGVRPSVISRRIRALEDTLGVSVFQRQSHGIKPTFAGKQILSKASLILNEVDALVQYAALSGSGAKGQLCIGIITSIAGGKTRELLVRFLSGHPGVEMDVVEGAPGDHANAVRTLQMDVALVVGSPIAIGCNVEPLWSEPIFVALCEKSQLAEASVLRWDQLSAERFIVSKVSSGPDIHDFVIRHLSDLGRTPVVEPRAVQRSGLLGLVSLGIGISLVGTAEASVTYPSVVFRRLEGEMLPFSVIWSDHNDNPALRRFLSLARVQTRQVL